MLRTARCASADVSSVPSWLARRATISSCISKRSVQGLSKRSAQRWVSAFSVNELDVDAHAAGVALDRPFKHIADPEFLADFPSIDITFPAT